MVYEAEVVLHIIESKDGVQGMQNKFKLTAEQFNKEIKAEKTNTVKESSEKNDAGESIIRSSDVLELLVRIIV